MSNTRVYTNVKGVELLANGAINSGGKMYFREPGANSTTLKDVYANAELTTTLGNPVILDSQGRAPNMFLNGDYNIQVTDANDVQQWRIDRYQPPEIEGQFAEWEAGFTYAVNDYVRYNGKYYVSLVSNNSGKPPSTSPTYWSELFFITVYNASTTYAEGAFVYFDGNLYTSLQNSNTGNTPDTSTDFWSRPGISVPEITDYQGEIIKYILVTTVPYSSLDVIANFPNGLTESAGPTGSGADYIWTVMDAIPDNAVSIQLQVSASASRTAGASALYSLQASFKATGLANNIPGCHVADYGEAAIPSVSRSETVIDVPVDSLNRFDVFHDYSNTDTETLNLRIIGFSVAEI